MSHIHWVTRQNKLEIPRDKDEVNKREIHECDGRAHDTGTMFSQYDVGATCDVVMVKRKNKKKGEMAGNFFHAMPKRMWATAAVAAGSLVPVVLSQDTRRTFAHCQVI